MRVRRPKEEKGFYSRGCALKSGSCKANIWFIRHQKVGCWFHRHGFEYVVNRSSAFSRHIQFSQLKNYWERNLLKLTVQREIQELLIIFSKIRSEALKVIRLENQLAYIVFQGLEFDYFDAVLFTVRKKPSPWQLIFRIDASLLHSHDVRRTWLNNTGFRSLCVLKRFALTNHLVRLDILHFVDCSKRSSPESLRYPPPFADDFSFWKVSSKGDFSKDQPVIWAIYLEFESFNKLNQR